MIGACPYTWPWNVLGWPAVNVPAGRTNGGLPIGAQLLGQADSEPMLLSLAAELQRFAAGTPKNRRNDLRPGHPRGDPASHPAGDRRAGRTRADQPADRRRGRRSRSAH